MFLIDSEEEEEGGSEEGEMKLLGLCWVSVWPGPNVSAQTKR